ncbi:MAG: (2Fe-2S) ferredoxin domain-containing protein [Mariprofundus sp.]
MSRPTVVAICHGPRCRDYGGRALAKQLECQGVTIDVLDCQSLCAYSPVVRMHDRVIHRATEERVHTYASEALLA